MATCPKGLRAGGGSRALSGAQVMTEAEVTGPGAFQAEHCNRIRAARNSKEIAGAIQARFVRNTTETDRPEEPAAQ